MRKYDVVIKYVLPFTVPLKDVGMDEANAVAKAKATRLYLPFGMHARPLGQETGIFVENGKARFSCAVEIVACIYDTSENALRKLAESIQAATEEGIECGPLEYDHIVYRETVPSCIYNASENAFRKLAKLTSVVKEDVGRDTAIALGSDMAMEVYRTVKMELVRQDIIAHLDVMGAVLSDDGVKNAVRIFMRDEDSGKAYWDNIEDAVKAVWKEDKEYDGKTEG